MTSNNLNTDLKNWRRTDPGNLGNSNQVHVWHVMFGNFENEIEGLLTTLSVDESERAMRFHFEKDRNHFIVARGILRKILSRYLGKEPSEIHFEYTRYGKPFLKSEPGSETLCFNLSHSGVFAVYAFARGKNVGIDIEFIHHNIEADLIARKFFSQGEINSLEKVDKYKRSELFFQYWTRKEALIKAVGEGISFPMELCDVSSINGRFLLPVTLPDNNRKNSYWYVQDLFPGDGYAAAIAVEGGDLDISCWHYSE